MWLAIGEPKIIEKPAQSNIQELPSSRTDEKTMTDRDFKQFQDLMDAELSSDDDVLERIEPRKNRKYNLSTNNPVPLEPGHFARDHIPVIDDS